MEKPKPKRPVSGYHMFVRDQLTNQTYDKANFAKQMKSIGTQWKAMSDSDKEQFVTEAAQVNRQRSKKGKAKTKTSKKGKTKSGAGKSKPRGASRKR